MVIPCWMPPGPYPTTKGITCTRAPRFVRAYSSADTRSTSLGPGWTHNYAVRVRCVGDGSGDLFFVRENGLTDRYALNGDGSYSPPPGVQARLVFHEPVAVGAAL